MPTVVIRNGCQFHRFISQSNELELAYRSASTNRTEIDLTSYTARRMQCDARACNSSPEAGTTATEMSAVHRTTHDTSMSKVNDNSKYVTMSVKTRRPASADRRARRQFQATGQTVSRTQASDAMTSRLPSYEAKCVQRRCFQCGSVPLRSDIKGTELPPANMLIPLERQLIALQLRRLQFLYNEPLQQTSRPLLSKLPQIREI